MSLNNNDALIADHVSLYYDDPLGFVKFAFRWDEGPLKGFKGPDVWQSKLLRHIGDEVKSRGFDGINSVMPIRTAVTSGHGIGKSAMVAFLILWVMSTRPNSKGTVTANTATQLKTKTWSELEKWRSRCITGHWFNVTGTAIEHVTSPKSWRADAITCREENSEAFAGQHEKESTSWYIFDEASNIPSKIWEVATGGLTDGEPMMFVFGNPTRNSGRKQNGHDQN